MVSTRMENRLENVEKRLEEMQTTFQEALRQQMEALRLELRGMRGEGGGENSNHEERNQRSNNEESRRDDRVKRVEVPYFTGEDPHGWIYRVERYFEVNRIPEEERVDTAVVCLEGKALNWYQWWESRMVVAVTWPMFRQAIMNRFQEMSSENPYETLMGLRQRGSVMEFREQFELRSAPLRFADEEFMKGVFMNGLKEEVKAEVRLMNQGRLQEMMDLAQKVEERNKVLGRTQGYQTRNPGSGNNRSALSLKWAGAQDNKDAQTENHGQFGYRGNPKNQMGSADNTRGGAVGSGTNAGRRGLNFKRLTEEEESEKQRRNLCFRCD